MKNLDEVYVLINELTTYQRMLVNEVAKILDVDIVDAFIFLVLTGSTTRNLLSHRLFCATMGSTTC